MIKLGETNVNSKGERFVINDYTNCNELTVMFEDNTVKKTTYSQVKSGHVSKKNAQEKSDWIGEIVEDANGEDCRISEYLSEENVTVQYPSGDIVSGLSFETVMSGSFTKKGEENLYKKSGEGIDTERTATKENVIYMLNRYRRCVMIRPCAFGKTRIGLELFSIPRYQKCLFLHPESDDLNAEVVKRRKSVKQIDTRTYAWIRRLPDEKVKMLDYDIVFCDEVHCIGGDNDKNGKPIGAYQTYSKMKLLMESHPKTHFVGATATPLRMDGINVIETMFHNHTCYPYTEEDAIEDGYLKKPDYNYSIHSLEKKLASELKKHINVEMSRNELMRTLHLTDEEIEEVDTKYMDKTIRKVCDELLPGQNRLSFIVFYLTNEEIAKNRDKVIKWFKKAYPTYQIKDIIVTARTKRSLDEVTKMLDEPTPENTGRIDLIFNCEKLCMSYHSKAVTGLILDRETRSITKYMQMIGRILSCDDDSPAIIFDIVDNLHSDFICPVPKRIDAEKVIPIFTKPETFAEVIAAYPKARHWEIIERSNKQARESMEDVIVETPATGNVLNNTYSMSGNWDGVELSGSEGLSIISGWTGRQNSTEDALKYAAAFMQAKAAGVTKTIPNTNQEQYDDALLEVAEPEETIDKGKDVGFDSSYYYDYSTGALYSKNINVLNKKADFEKDILEAAHTYKVKQYEAIIKNWHKYPKCDEVYSSYKEVDKSNPKYKFLKSCSEWLFGIPVNEILKYMIEEREA